jgi:predicted ferric reductase
MKYYKRINRYTLFQITLVYVPTMAASAYNLFYTWYGRQVFWIDIECILVGLVMIILHIKIILRTQGEYIKRLEEIEEMDRKAAEAAFYEKHGYSI